MRGKGVPTGMSKRKPYIVPRVIQYESEAAYPDRMKAIAKSLREESERKLSPQFKVEPQYIVVVDTDRKYVEVSDNFCQLVGYQREELVGKRYDDLTAPNTNDIPTIFGLFEKLGYMHGLWMLVNREGTLSSAATSLNTASDVIDHLNPQVFEFDRWSPFSSIR